MATCACGARMARFENPPRLECSDPAKHAQYEREQRQHSGGARKGSSNPGAGSRFGKKKGKWQDEGTRIV